MRIQSSMAYTEDAIARGPYDEGNWRGISGQRGACECAVRNLEQNCTHEVWVGGERLSFNK